ncbi:hypothetical protein FG386_002408 [Cryptosporidium ryanae]|uniref:uncharacterized protein n=1 Tax=Cryptosporidium ryanae TaxID=515981 RepID=UPI00351A6F21|nr:hypothetical protein FG386_002408 [Cryptosporidium ryanae]
MGLPSTGAEGLMVPTRRGAARANDETLSSYDKTQMERIRARDQINRLEQVRELNRIDEELSEIVRRIKSRKNIDLVYRVTILKVHLRRFLESATNGRRRTRGPDKSFACNPGLDFKETGQGGSFGPGRREGLHFSLMHSGSSSPASRGRAGFETGDDASNGGGDVGYGGRDFELKHGRKPELARRNDYASNLDAFASKIRRNVRFKSVLFQVKSELRRAEDDKSTRRERELAAKAKQAAGGLGCFGVLCAQGALFHGCMGRPFVGSRAEGGGSRRRLPRDKCERKVVRTKSEEITWSENAIRSYVLALKSQGVKRLNINTGGGKDSRITIDLDKNSILNTKDSSRTRIVVRRDHLYDIQKLLESVRGVRGGVEEINFDVEGASLGPRSAENRSCLMDKSGLSLVEKSEKPPTGTDSPKIECRFPEDVTGKRGEQALSAELKIEDVNKQRVSGGDSAEAEPHSRSEGRSATAENASGLSESPHLLEGGASSPGVVRTHTTSNCLELRKGVSKEVGSCETKEGGGDSVHKHTLDIGESGDTYEGGAFRSNTGVNKKGASEAGIYADDEAEKRQPKSREQGCKAGAGALHNKDSRGGREDSLCKIAEVGRSRRKNCTRKLVKKDSRSLRTLRRSGKRAHARLRTLLKDDNSYKGRRYVNVRLGSSTVKRYGLNSFKGYEFRGVNEVLMDAENQRYLTNKLFREYNGKNHIEYALEDSASYVYGINKHRLLLSITCNALNEDVNLFKLSKLNKYALSSQMNNLEDFVEEVMGEMILNGDLNEKAHTDLFEEKIMRLRYLINTEKCPKQSTKMAVSKRQIEQINDLWGKLISTREQSRGARGNLEHMAPYGDKKSSGDLWNEISKFVFEEEVDFFKDVYYPNESNSPCIKGKQGEEGVLDSIRR